MKDTLQLGSLGALVRQLQGMLTTVGISLDDDGVFGNDTDAAVRAFQLWRKLRVDGIVGRKTWLELEDCVDRKETKPEPAVVERDPDALRLAGEEAIDAALEHWRSDIYDPRANDASADAGRCKAVIDRLIKLGLGWTWEPSYKGDGYFEWCGAFAALCWLRVKPELRKLYFASTYRLDRYARYEPAFGEKNEGSGRLILDLDEDTSVTELTAKWQVQKGDILLIGPKGYGQHICLVESFDADGGYFNTIEGNGTGKGPHGEHQQGVVRARRFLGGVPKGSWCARRIIRPSADDLD